MEFDSAQLRRSAASHLIGQSLNEFGAKKWDRGWCGAAAEEQRQQAQVARVAEVLGWEAAGPDQYISTPGPCLPLPASSLP